MAYAFRTMIVPAELAGLARALAAGLSPAGSGMFETALSATGDAPATHYISSGLIDPQFSDAIATPAALYAACRAVGASVTLAQCEALVSQSDVSSDAPFDAMARLGLAIVQSGEA